jgi:asparagine synthase (glutamine-hydrolysing)
LASHAAGAQIFKTRPKAEELLDDLRRIVELQDEPFTTTSIYAQYKVFQLIHRQGVKVVLDGQGADELLGGYSNYQGARFASLIHQRRWGAACRFWKAATASAHGRRLLFYAGEFLLPSYLQSPFRYWLGKDLVPAWIERSWFIKRGVSLVPPRSLSRRFQEELANSVEVNLQPLLRYEDRNSMAFSIESRVPFLTPEMVNFIFSLPEEYIIAPDGTSKAVFRRAMRGVVPDGILDRRDKVGFETPEQHWLRALQPWVEKTFRSQAARRIPALRPMILAAASKASLQGRQRFGWQFWRCLNLIHWSEMHQVQF